MKQYIEFLLGNENYAVDMKHVREIVKLVKVTKLMGAPEYVKGISKLRDHVITIIDLRHKFKLDAATLETREPQVVVLEFGSENIGLWVDDVIDILESDNVENIPSVIHCGVVRELVKMENRIIPILDINNLFSSVGAEWLTSEESSIDQETPIIMQI